MSTEHAHAGLGREQLDARDFIYEPPALDLPPARNLVDWDWPVWNQAQLNSCTAQVVAGAVMFLVIKERVHEPFDPSRLFIYYNERLLFDEIENPNAHAIDHNAPVYMRDGIKALARWGCCRADQWHGDPAELLQKMVERPPQEAYDFAQQHKTIHYFKLDVKGKPQEEKLHLLRSCLAHGYPFSIGIHVFTNLSAVPDGAIPTPPADAKASGGHALLVTGYDDATKTFHIRNSYGSAWGKQGYGTIGYDYVCDDRYTDSFWTIRRVT